MTNQEILQKAIEKAGDNADRLMDIFDDKLFNTYGNNLRMDLVRGYIFSHDFAKAFYGEKEFCSCCKRFPETVKEGWQYHLQQQVLAEDPIKYMEAYL